MTPATETRPCDGRAPNTPQLLAGTPPSPAVSVPRAKSTSPQATAEAEPLEEPPGTRSGTARIERRAVEMVLAQQAERRLVGDRLAGEIRTTAVRD